MNLIMSDCPLSFSPSFSSGQNTVIDLSALNISPCLGCFGCWVKTPGKCVIPDDAHKVYPLIAKSENVIYVTRLFHGSYRCISNCRRCACFCQSGNFADYQCE